MYYLDMIIGKLGASKIYGTTGLFGEKVPIGECSEEIRKLFEMLPTEKLEALHYADLRGEHSFDEWWNTRVKLGYAECEPKITGLDKKPSLMLEYNKFLQLYKGNTYQVSYTVDGEGVYSSSPCTLGKINSIFEDIDDKLPMPKSYQYLLYMGALTAASGIDSFEKLLFKNVNIFDTFMKVSLKQYFANDITVTHDELLSLPKAMSYDSFRELPISEIYRVCKSDTTDFIRLYVHNNLHIIAELIVNGRPRLIDFNLRQVIIDERELLAKHGFNTTKLIYKLMQEPTVKILFITYVLHALGMCVDYNTVLFRSEFKEWVAMPALNSPKVIKLYNLNAIE